MNLPGTDLLHQKDTHLLEFEARVLAVRPHPDGGVEAALDRSAFYVESGGQPSDRGTLAGLAVTGLRKEEGVVWHRLEPGGNAPLPGDPVRGSVDRAVRLDHMQQHTGQHILSQAFVRVGDLATRSFHLGKEESTIDLAGAEPGPLLLDEVSRVANVCVMADVPVRIHFADRASRDRFPLRREPGTDHEILRVIEIEGYDFSACGGTHAARTGEVGPIEILGVEKSKALWRIRFLAGERALRYGREAHRVLQELARAHSCHWRDLPAAAAARAEEQQELRRQLRRLLAERAEREADRLYAEAPAAEGVRCFEGSLEGLGGEELKTLAARFVSLGPAILVASVVEGERRHWIAARSRDLPEGRSSWHAGNVLRELLAQRGGKGGGTETFAQGTSPAGA